MNNFTPTVTISLSDYEHMNDELKRLYSDLKEIDRALVTVYNKDSDEIIAQALAVNEQNSKAEIYRLARLGKL